MSTEASPTAVFEPTEEARKFYREFIAELEKRQLSGSENFDKSVLTLSSAGLGLSIGFLKDFAAFKPVEFQWLLYASWLLFTVATVGTMASFLFSSKAMDSHKSIAYRFYFEDDKNAFNERSNWDIWTGRLNISSAVAFALALIATIFFITINLESYRMAIGNNNSVNNTELSKKGAPVPSMQRPASAPASAPTAPPAPAQPVSK